LILAIVLPLFWRRKAPSAIFVIIFAAALAQAVFTPDLTDDLALLFAFYTVADREPLRRVLTAVVALECGAVLAAAILYKRPGHDVEHVGLAWVGLSVLVAVTGLLGYYTRARRAYLERERERDVELVAAAERARIAREMHDIVAHNIAVMIALADGAAYTAEASPRQAASLMGQVSATGRSALTEMRRLLGVLHEPAAAGNAPQPGLNDVEDLIATVRAVGLPTRLTVTGQPFPLPSTAQLALYRMIQEALTNTLKHAPGATAQVRLAYVPGGVELEVTDDGRPGALAAGGESASLPGSGHGIAGMRERAALFGGEVSAGPRPGGGWRVHIMLPLDPEPDEGGKTPLGTSGTGTRTATEDA
jgi:signal transduction histidine kinase